MNIIERAGEVKILDGLVTVASQPFTTVHIRDSLFARWDSTEIAAYHKLRARWSRWGWLRKFGFLGGWVADKKNVPNGKPSDRMLLIERSTFSHGRSPYA